MAATRRGNIRGFAMTGNSYAEAGVNIDACDTWLASLKSRVPSIGGFAGIFPIPKECLKMESPMLVAGTDGVGTKVMVAKAAGNLSTIGIDCVAMVVNDLICCGAKPLFFLDYLAVGKFESRQADDILKGILEGCRQSNCELLGGETAELPGLFQPGDFDIAGFGVGVVDKNRLVDGSEISKGDVIIGLASSGLHSNGFSLARKIFPSYVEDTTLLENLLTPTKIYVSSIISLISNFQIKGLSHITGGGIPGNLNRSLPKNVNAVIDVSSWKVPEIFQRLKSEGNVSNSEMFRTFNMGIGFCVVVKSRDSEGVLQQLKELGEVAFLIGEISEGEGKVILS